MHLLCSFRQMKGGFYEHIYSWENGRMTSKLEVNECKIRFIIVVCQQKQMFESRNNIVSLAKQYCLTDETLVFDEPNNIVCVNKHATLSLEWNVYASGSVCLVLK